MMMLRQSRRAATGLFLLASGVVSLGATEGPLSAAPLAAAATPSCAAPVNTRPIAQRVEQLLMVSGQFANLGASTSQAAAGVGGFVFFGQPAAGSGPAIGSGLAALVSAAAQRGQIVPWMSTDEEGGPIARLSNVIGALPSPRQMAAQWTPAQVQSVLARHASAMRSLGMTMDLAPVLDTANPNDTVAGENYRSFSENGQVAANYGLAYANGLRAGGIVPVAKHFPGLGHASADTDTAPAVDPPLSQLQADDLIPFEKAAAAGLPVIMVGHPVVPGLTGGLPASLSPSTYHLLRGQLSFGGVAMTDDLDAVAISAAGYSQPAAAVKAVEAGADMVMIDSSQWSATVNALSQAVSSGALSLGQLDASVTRILREKGVTFCSGITYAPGSNGSIQELFAVGANNQVYNDYEVPGGAWSGWHLFPGPALYGPITYAPGSNGSIQELFAVGANNQVYNDGEAPGGAWSGWRSLGVP
jgi:beta-N-acetylhexosaminidase